MAGTCTVYKSKNFGPKWSGTNELAAYFTCDDGKGLGAVGELIDTDYSIVIDPLASVQTQSADADTSTVILSMDKYTDMSIYISNIATDQAMTAQVWSCPPQPTKALRDAAASAITEDSSGFKRLETTFNTIAPYGCCQEGDDIAVADDATDLRKINATGGLMAVAVKLAAASHASGKIRVYVVGEFA